MAKAGSGEKLKIIPVELQIKDSGVWTKAITVTVPAEEVNREFNANIGTLAGKINLPGFRPGKVPRDVLEKKFGSGIQKEVAATLLNNAFHSALEKEHLQAVGEPKLDAEEYKAVRNTPFTFEVEVEIKPQFELSNYSGLPIEQEEVELLPDELENALKHMAERFATQADAPADHAICDRDAVKGNLRVLVGGKEVHKEESELLVLDNHVLGAYSHLESKFLLGAKSGETRTVEAKLNDHFPVAEYRGQTATLEWQVLSMRVSQLPPLDDAFAQKAGLKDLEELKEKVRASMLEKLSDDTNSRTRLALLDRVVGATQFELPKRFSERLAEAATAGRLRELSQYGISPEMLSSHEDFQSKMKETGLLEARRFFVLDAICEKENIKVTEEAIDEEIVKLARQRSMRASELYDQIMERDEMRDLVHDLRTRKALDYLVEHADIKIVPRKAPEKHEGHEHCGEAEKAAQPAVEEKEKQPEPQA